MTTALVNCSARGTLASQRRYGRAGLRRKTSEIASVSKRNATPDQSSFGDVLGPVLAVRKTVSTSSSDPSHPPARPARPASGPAARRRSNCANSEAGIRAATRLPCFVITTESPRSVSRRQSAKCALASATDRVFGNALLLKEVTKIIMTYFSHVNAERPRLQGTDGSLRLGNVVLKALAPGA